MLWRRMGSGGIALHILIIRIRWRRVITFIHFTPGERVPERGWKVWLPLPSSPIVSRFTDSLSRIFVKNAGKRTTLQDFAMKEQLDLMALPLCLRRWIPWMLQFVYVASRKWDVQLHTFFRILPSVFVTFLSLRYTVSCHKYYITQLSQGFRNRQIWGNVALQWLPPMLLIHVYPVNLLKPALLVEYVHDFSQFFPGEF
jgi:hypothetical protein